MLSIYTVEDSVTHVCALQWSKKKNHWILELHCAQHVRPIIACVGF